MLYRDYLKRILDIFLAIILAIIFSPVLLLAPIAIKLDSEGPVFYKQRRVGRGGKGFILYKFRSMRKDADKILLKEKKLLKEFKQKEGWKMEDDPRITDVGSWLRKLTLDELPQIWNVLAGDMSIVGPRAYRNDEVGNEIEEQLKYFPSLRKNVKKVLAIKPGITGPWQVTGRNELSWDKRVSLDTEYVNKLSLWGDLKIILKTPAAMINKW